MITEAERKSLDHLITTKQGLFCIASMCVRNLVPLEEDLRLIDQQTLITTRDLLRDFIHVLEGAIQNPESPSELPQ